MVGESAYDPSSLLIDDTNSSFDVPNMITSRKGIDGEHGDMITYVSNLISIRIA